MKLIREQSSWESFNTIKLTSSTSLEENKVTHYFSLNVAPRSPFGASNWYVEANWCLIDILKPTDV